MGKTYKDTANQLLHHRIPEDNGNLVWNGEGKLKSRGHKDRPVSVKVQAVVDTLEHADYNAGHRHGNHRKWQSEAKVIERRGDRAKGRQEFRKELEDVNE